MNNKWTVLAINPGHNGSAALVVDGNLIFYAEEERLSRMKYDGNPFRAILQCLDIARIDELVLGGTSPEFSKLPWTMEDAYTALVRKFNPNVKVTNLGYQHHIGHAANAFYNSGFKTAVAVVIDGAGSVHSAKLGEEENAPFVSGYETESIYKCNYPAEFEALYKRYSDGMSAYFNNGIQEFDNSVTLTKAYEAVSDYLGFGFIEAGKTMGLAPYGRNDDSIPDFFIEGKGNKNLLIPRYPAGAFIDETRFHYLRRTRDPKEWHNNFSLIKDVDKNLAYKVQKQTEEQMIDLIQRAIDLTGERNVVISGGYGLNCVANYRYLEKFPNINFYIDPISHDGGTSIGLAKLAWHSYSNSLVVEPLKHLYLGVIPNYDHINDILESARELKLIDADSNTVTQLLVDQNIVAMFSGRSEGGPRALGNRSILFDPRNPNGKNIVNRVKGREWFRPFAGSVLEEHASEWFDLRTLKSSPFMMYAVNVLPSKLNEIPAVTHVDGTCRVQTVNQEDNAHYYTLIKSFYEKTNIPVIFNTSFNLAGEPLVDNLFDAANTILRSDIKYLYLPDIGKMLVKD